MSRRNNRSSGKQARFRRAVLVRADGRCESCGLTLAESWKLQAHHVTAKADGGPSTAENGIALCPACHEAQP